MKKVFNIFLSAAVLLTTISMAHADAVCDGTDPQIVFKKNLPISLGLLKDIHLGINAKAFDLGNGCTAYLKQAAGTPITISAEKHTKMVARITSANDDEQGGTAPHDDLTIQITDSVFSNFVCNNGLFHDGSWTMGYLKEILAQGFVTDIGKSRACKEGATVFQAAQDANSSLAIVQPTKRAAGEASSLSEKADSQTLPETSPDTSSDAILLNAAGSAL